MSNAQEWMTTQQAAAYLGYSVKSITRFCRSNQLKHSRSGARSQYRFKAEWLDRFIACDDYVPPTNRKASSIAPLNRSERLMRKINKHKERKLA